MVEVLASNDLVYLSWVEALLRDAGFGVVVADQHVSAIEGSICAIPRRVLVAGEDEAAARQVLQAAGALAPQ